MSPLSVLSLFVSFLFFFIAVLSFSHGQRSSVRRLFSSLAFSLGLWAFFYAFVYSAHSEELAYLFYRLSSFGWVTFSAFSLHFAIEFSHPKKGRPLYFLLYIPTLVFLYKALTGNLMVTELIFSEVGWIEIPNRQSIWYYLFVLYYTTYVSAAIYLLWSKKRKTKSLKEAKQVGLLLGPALFSFLAGSFFNVVLPFFKVFYLPALAPVITLVFALGATNAILKYQLFNVTPSIAADHVMELMGDYLFLLDLDKRVTHVNKKVEVDLGYTKEEIQDKSLFSSLFKDGEAPLNEGSETELLTKSGEYIPVQIFTREIRDRSGEITGYAIVARDLREKKKLEEEIEVRKRVEDALYKAHEQLESKVKERTKELLQVNETLRSEIEERKKVEEFLKYSEEKYRLLFENAADAICTLDKNLNFTSLNRKALDLFGREEREILGKNLFETGLIHEDCRALVYRSLSELSSKIKLTRGEIKLVSGNGEVKDCEVTSASYLDRAKGEIAIVSILRDVTEQKKMQQEVLKAKKQESLAILAKGIAHDFNNLLAVIMGNISLARLSLEDKGKLLRRLEDAENAILKTKELVSKILDFAEKKTGRKTLLSIDRILKEQAQLILSGTAIECEYLFPSQIPPIYGDEDQISQVINGIIWNAREAMSEKGTLTIKVDVISLPPKNLYSLEKGDYVKVTIKDTGIGIKEEYLSRVFEPYFSTKELGPKKGTGLTLALAYTFVKNHGGHIEIESKQGSGTSVHIYLPVYGELQTKGMYGSRTFEGRVLVMEDEPVLRDLLGEILVTFGFQVECVKEGAEAVKLYEESIAQGKPFDVVLLDLVVHGGMGAEETIERLREIDPNVKAVLMSGYVHDPKSIDLEKLGFTTFISKPFEVESLISLLKNLVRERDRFLSS